MTAAEPRHNSAISAYLVNAFIMHPLIENRIDVFRERDAYCGGRQISRGQPGRNKREANIRIMTNIGTSLAGIFMINGVFTQPGQLGLAQCMLGAQSSIPRQQSSSSHWYNPVWLHTKTSVSRAMSERTEKLRR